MNKTDYNSSTNQEIKGKFVSREVFCNVNSLMENQKGWENSEILDEIENYCIPTCPQCGTIHYDLVEGDSCMPGCDGIPESEPQEILEWWAVSNWLAEKLKEHGQPVYDSGSVMLWGRTCSGQAILLDGVISRICADLEILEGQSSDWSKTQLKAV